MLTGKYNREMEAFRRLLSRALLVGRAPRTRGRVRVPGLAGEAEVLRDRWGIPHIRARSAADALFAQGFAHAQDRLSQMQIMRLLTSGRLATMAGESALPLDWHARMLGMPEMKARAFDACTDEEKALLAAYAAGVNACVGSMKRLPIELAPFGPLEPWTEADCLTSLPYLSWVLMFSPFAEKLLAVARGSALDLAAWNDIFPGHPGAVLPADDWFERARSLRFGAIHPGALAFHGGLSGDRSAAALTRILQSLAPGAGGSNNWVVARGADGLPLLANDPHLGASLPAIWYFCHMDVADDMNVAGASLPGSPGIVIGRTEHAAWGLTNLMLDAADILTYRVDPADPRRYYVGDHALRMREVPHVFGLPRGKSVTIPIHLTEAGPVITMLEPGVTAVAVLKWYGTLRDDELADRSLPSTLSFMKARSVAEMLHAGSGWKYTAQNLVAADDGGHIGWHGTGAAPVRRGYSGRLPGDASAGAGWTGFHPHESLPGAVDPPQGWIATANYRPEESAGGVPVYGGRGSGAGGAAAGGAALSYVWFPPWRVRRIGALLRAAPRPDPEYFRRMQMDVHSIQADLLVPKILALPLASPAARRAAALLASWDREVRADSAGAAVFEVFITELARALLSGPLAGDLALYFNARTYGPENEILDRPGSPLWPAAPALIVEHTLCRTMALCSSLMGHNVRHWVWGRLHHHVFRHPAAGAGGPAAWLLNPARRFAHGDANTINVSAPSVRSNTYNVSANPSLRMIVPLGDLDGMLIIGPLGQSGQPGHRHYDDMTDAWIKGEMARLPLTRAGVDAQAQEKLVLVPGRVRPG